MPASAVPTDDRRPTSCLGINPAESKSGQIEFVDKNVDNTNRIVLPDPVFHTFRKQRALPAMLTFNEPLHPRPPRIVGESYSANHIKRSVFTQVRRETGME